MPLYYYEAINSSGRLVRDQGNFDSHDSLYQGLKKRGLTLTNYRRRWFLSGDLGKRHIKRMVVAEFLRNLAMTIKGGVTLMQAIEDFMDSPLEPVLKAKLSVIHERLAEGFQFSEAMQEAGGFPPLVIVLAKIGEESGTLDKTLKDAAVHLETVQDILNKTRSALSYPIFVLLAMSGALGFWLLYVFPQMLELFKGMGITHLPVTTRVLIGAVDILKVWWPLILSIPGAFGVLTLMARRYDRIKYYLDILWIKLPLFGRIIRASLMAFFFEYLSLLTAAGIDIVRSMEIMTDSVGNQVMKKGLEQIRRDVMAGHGLTTAFRATGFFDNFIIRLVNVGEQTGNMPEQLKELARYHMKKVNRLVNAISKAIEPVMIVFAGGMFILIALGLLGPIYDLMTRLQ